MCNPIDEQKYKFPPITLFNKPISGDVRKISSKLNANAENLLDKLKINSMVKISEVIDSQTFKTAKSKVTVALGKDITNNIIIFDLAKMPHVLITGSVGSGKSVCINSIILSLLYKASPDEVKFLMIDTKLSELGIYNGIPHLMIPVVSAPHKAVGVLKWAVNEMLKRYKIFVEYNVSDLHSYNEKCRKSFDIKPMPQIVIIFEELSDLMMVAPNEVEEYIYRLAQFARAAGIHLIISTQRISVDVITDVIKDNIPSRIVFAVSPMINSRMILGSSDAEKLLGCGDMLYYPIGMSKPLRVQGCFASDKEINNVINYINSHNEANYDEKIAIEIDRHTTTFLKTAFKNKKHENGDVSEDGICDELLVKAISIVLETGIASTSMLQRRLKLGCARAAYIIDKLEEKGVIGRRPFEETKPWQVLMTKQQWLEQQSKN